MKSDRQVLATKGAHYLPLNCCLISATALFAVQTKAAERHYADLNSAKRQTSFTGAVCALCSLALFLFLTFNSHLFIFQRALFICAHLCLGEGNNSQRSKARAKCLQFEKFSSYICGEKERERRAADTQQSPIKPRTRSTITNTKHRQQNTQPAARVLSHDSNTSFRSAKHH